MGPRPPDFDEQLVRQSPTFIKWAQLERGEKLRYACREFIKNHGDDEERLMRRIMIARRNNLRDHQTLKRARQLSGNDPKGGAAESDGRDHKAMKRSVDATAPPPPPSRKRRPSTLFSDSEVTKEMDVPAVEATRSYRAWLELEEGAVFVYNQKYIKGREGHDWLLRKNIWRRMRYRRENKKMVEKLRGEIPASSNIILSCNTTTNGPLAAAAAAAAAAHANLHLSNSQQTQHLQSQHTQQSQSSEQHLHHHQTGPMSASSLASQIVDQTLIHTDETAAAAAAAAVAAVAASTSHQSHHLEVPAPTMMSMANGQSSAAGVGIANGNANAAGTIDGASQTPSGADISHGLHHGNHQHHTTTMASGHSMPTAVATTNDIHSDQAQSISDAVEAAVAVAESYAKSAAAAHYHSGATHSNDGNGMVHDPLEAAANSAALDAAARLAAAASIDEEAVAAAAAAAAQPTQYTEEVATI